MPLIKSPTSYMNQNPQENQYLQGNPAIDPNAQTGWMDPSSSNSNWIGSASGSSTGKSFEMSGGLVGDGTALSSIVGGNGGVGEPTGPRFNPNGNTGITGGMGWNPEADNRIYGNGGGMPPSGQPQGPIGQSPSNNGFGQYTPEGYDINKPDANSMKYQIGRILSNYPPGSEGLQQAASQLAAIGIRVVGRDRIMLPDGTTSDVGRAFSDTNPNANRAWQYNWSGPGGGSADAAMRGSSINNLTSFMGNNQSNQEQQSLMNQIMFQNYQRNRGSRFGALGGASGSTASRLAGGLSRLF